MKCIIVQYSDCHKKLLTALNELQLLKKEYEEYKTKATNILQVNEHIFIYLSIYPFVCLFRVKSIKYQLFGHQKAVEHILY